MWFNHNIPTYRVNKYGELRHGYCYYFFVFVLNIDIEL